MTDTKLTIELPRIEGESARAYAARVEYVTMGAGRSIEKLADQRRIKGGSKAITPLREWSIKYGWVDSARQYDEQVSYLTVQEAADRYRADLEAHRKRASDAAQGLYTVAGQLIKAMNQALANPRKIEGKDGKIYTLHGVDLNASAYSAAVRGMQTALDLEAHSLGIDQLMPSLTPDDSE
jgi:hypothetical protein